MYQRIELENLRGIEHLSCDGLRRINLIVGKNNAGKTTLPESLSLLRIDLIDGRHSIVDYDEDSRMAILEEHFEVRG